MNLLRFLVYLFTAVSHSGIWYDFLRYCFASFGCCFVSTDLALVLWFGRKLNLIYMDRGCINRFGYICSPPPSATTNTWSIFVYVQSKPMSICWNWVWYSAAVHIYKFAMIPNAGLVFVFNLKLCYFSWSMDYWVGILYICGNNTMRKKKNL